MNRAVGLLRQSYVLFSADWVIESFVVLDLDSSGRLPTSLRILQLWSTDILGVLLENSLKTDYNSTFCVKLFPMYLHEPISTADSK